MAPIMLIQADAIIASDVFGPATTDDECIKPAKIVEPKALAVAATLDVVEEDATDIGQGSASETESSSGISSEEGSCATSKRCRFGETPLGTVPATTTRAVTSVGSPPGLSRAAMRQARDACKPEANPVSTARFDETPFGTVPKTPAGAAKFKALAKVFGSPPGLSRAEMRLARDSCKGAALPPSSWGSHIGESPLTRDSALSPGKQQAARNRLCRMKQEAALLKDLKNGQMLDGTKLSTEASADIGSTQTESSSDGHVLDGQRCRFEGKALGTTPSTPVRGQASLPSPPGLSRKAMRQARDACKGGLPAAEWGSSTGTVLTINPAGKPVMQHCLAPR